MDNETSIPELQEAWGRAKAVPTKLNLAHKILDGYKLSVIVLNYSGCLTELRVDCRLVNRDSYSMIAHFTKLQHLSLYKALELDDTQLEKILRGLPDLEILRLDSSAKLTDFILAHIANLRKVRELTFHECLDKIGEPLVVLNRIATLRALRFGSSEFQIEVLRNLTTLANLRELSLKIRMTPENFNIIHENFKNLEVLRLGSCAQLTDTEGTKFRLFRRLKTLSFLDGHGFTNRTFEEGLGSPSMEHLAICRGHLTWEAFNCLASHHTRFKELLLLNLPKITDRGLRALLQKQKHLRAIALAGCTTLTGACLTVLADNCPLLQHVDMRNIPSVGRRAERYFREMKPSVRFRHSQ